MPVNLAALSEAGIAGEIQAQIDRGTQLLHQAGLHPESGLWVDTASSFSQGDAGYLASGLQVAGAGQLVLNDGDLASGGRSSLTFAQPFTLDLGSGTDPSARASDSNLERAVHGLARRSGARGAAAARRPLLRALREHVRARRARRRGLPAVGLAGDHGVHGHAAHRPHENPVLKATTLSDLMSQVPAGGNREPTTRRLQAGPAGRSISRAAGQKIAVGRQQLTSYSSAVSGHPPVLVGLGDLLLSTESQRLTGAGRTGALSAFDRAFGGETGKITLATERTVTFTSQRAPIPITVLSSAPYAVRVVVTLNSDKFTFPDGNTQPLTLDRPTTSVRVTAQARTSGDRLPIEVTLHTPDGQLLIAHTVLTVQSTEISFVGVALTVLAGAVLLGVVGAHLAPGAPGAPAGALTVAVPRRARTLSLRTSAAYVGVGTGVSRVTGLLRFVALAWALGQTPLADSYNLANTTPNMLYDVVLGGVLSATFIPVFVDRLSNREEREAFESISAVLTVSIVVLVSTTAGGARGGARTSSTPSPRSTPTPTPTSSTACTSSARWPPSSCAGS